jgi:hypothetical protein
MYIKKIKNRKKIKDCIFIIRKDLILRGRKERVTIWFWLAGPSYKKNLKNRNKKEKNVPQIILYFCIWIKISIPVARSLRYLIGLRFLFVLLERIVY